MSDLPATRSATLADPVTGEVLELDATSDVLATCVDEFKRREAQYKAWRRLAEDELAARLAAHNRRRVTVGEWEIELESLGRARVWDTVELEQTLGELVDAGVLHAGELTGLLTPQPAKLDGKLAANLLGRVTDSARAALERCFRWEQKGRPRLTVTRSVQLLPPSDAPEGPSAARKGME